MLEMFTGSLCMIYLYLAMRITTNWMSFPLPWLRVYVRVHVRVRVCV